MSERRTDIIRSTATKIHFYDGNKNVWLPKNDYTKEDITLVRVQDFRGDSAGWVPQEKQKLYSKPSFKRARRITVSHENYSNVTQYNMVSRFKSPEALTAYLETYFEITLKTYRTKKRFPSEIYRLLINSARLGLFYTVLDNQRSDYVLRYYTSHFNLTRMSTLDGVSREYIKNRIITGIRFLQRFPTHLLIDNLDNL